MAIFWQPGYVLAARLLLPRRSQRLCGRQVLKLFPSAAALGEPTWHSVVKIGQSLYREAPGVDPWRPDQATPVKRMFLAGSYTKQDYIDSMEGATLSGRLCAGKVLAAAPALARAPQRAQPELVAA